MQLFILFYLVFLNLLLGALPLDYGPALPGSQGPKTRQRTTILVPCLLDFHRPLSTSLLQAFLFLLEQLDNAHPRHVLESCTAVEFTRETLGIRAFLDDCRQAGRSRATAYKYYLLGFDKNGVKVDLALYFKRGSSLKELTESWLSTWEDPEDDV